MAQSDPERTLGRPWPDPENSRLLTQPNWFEEAGEPDLKTEDAEVPLAQRADELVKAVDRALLLGTLVTMVIAMDTQEQCWSCEIDLRTTPRGATP